MKKLIINAFKKALSSFRKEENSPLTRFEKMQEMLKKHELILSFENKEAEKQVRIFARSLHGKPALVYESGIFPNWEMAIQSLRPLSLQDKVSPLAERISKNFLAFHEDLDKFAESSPEIIGSYTELGIRDAKESLMRILGKDVVAAKITSDPIHNLKNKFLDKAKEDENHKEYWFTFKELTKKLEKNIEESENTLKQKINQLLESVPTYFIKDETKNTYQLVGVFYVS